MDENKVVELSDGSLMLNSRASDGSGFRKVAHSTDGGQTWSEPVSDKNLPDSVDNAQIIRAFPNAAPDDPRAKVLLLSHSPNPKPWSRDRGTISMSCDDGASWTTSKVFHEPFVGYTTIAVQSDGSIGLLSEDAHDGANYGGIWYRNFTMNWLGEQCGQKPAEPSPAPSPTAAPSAAPSEKPAPSAAPSIEPTQAPAPSSAPEPSAAPEPSSTPAPEPTTAPSTEPTPAPAPSSAPEQTDGSTAAPAPEASSAPAAEPTQAPTVAPSAEPTQAPGAQPSAAPSEKPGAQPSSAPKPGATSQAPSVANPKATAAATQPGKPSSSANPAPSRSAAAPSKPGMEPDEIDRPSDGAMAQPTGGASTPSAVPTQAAKAGSRLSRTGTNALLVLGLAGVAVVGGYLLLRARRSKN